MTISTQRTKIALRKLSLVCFFLWSAIHITVSAFVPRTTTSKSAPTTWKNPDLVVSAPKSYSNRICNNNGNSVFALFAKIPRIDEWEILKSGAVRGTIVGSSDYPEGYEITTSPIDKESSNIKDNSMVTTVSGSKYKLLKALPPKEKKSLFGNRNGSKEPDTKAPAKPVTKTKGTSSKPVPTKDYDLNGKVLGSKNADYLLVGNLVRSSSKRSQIYYAYKADKDGNPSGRRLITKLQTSDERLSRESKNYNRVFSKARVLFALDGANSCYVRKVGYVQNKDLSSSTTGVPNGVSALILESGDQNLRAYLSERKSGLSGSDLRRAAYNIVRCIEAMHSSGLVWTDLKTENFVVMSSGNGPPSVKGIDLESAVPVKSSPEDYSPEACPPEFAMAEKAGEGYQFKCLKNYDTWSAGMVFYELATGKSYFAGQSEGNMLNMLATAGREGGKNAVKNAVNTGKQTIVDPNNSNTLKGLDAIEDSGFRNLVKSCLSINPNKRPSIGQILLNPYFLTTGIGPLAF